MEDTILTAEQTATLKKMVEVSTKDSEAELEVKILHGAIVSKDIADRLVEAIEKVATGPEDTHRATFSYPNGTRIHVHDVKEIQKVCINNSFRDIAVKVERKQGYKEVDSSVNDSIRVDDVKLRFTLRKEVELRKDFAGKVNDPANHIRVMHRKSWTTKDGLLRIDLSMVKSKAPGATTISAVLKRQPIFELEIEVVNKQAGVEALTKSMLHHVHAMLVAYQGSPFLMKEVDAQTAVRNLLSLQYKFLNPVTLERKHLVHDRPHNILKGYTVTNKADGERSFLFVERDGRVLRITPSQKASWTGWTAVNPKEHHGDIVDGEYLADSNRFCIFDVYRYRGKDLRSRPHMGETMKDTRLGAAVDFVTALNTGAFKAASQDAVRIETKKFLSGDFAAMERSIVEILNTDMGYPSDGLIFTPRGPLPASDQRGSVWNVAYKWKPPQQNSIDFLVRFKPSNSIEAATGRPAFKGTLYISKTPGNDVTNPCETLTGEYVPPVLPSDMRGTSDRVPAPFQPSNPIAPEAYQIYLPLNAVGVPVDEEGKRVEDNTIIECARDVVAGRWIIMRTRYDKTHQYRVLKKPQFGNDIRTAESIWTNIHNPVEEAALKRVFSDPIKDDVEDENYYRDSLEARERVMKDVYAFHNEIKDKLYAENVKVGDTLLELGVGRAGDMHKWRRSRVKLVVGIDANTGNLSAPRQGACVRYLKDPQRSTLPPALFITGDMTKPLYEQDNRYIAILKGEAGAPTEYLKTFENIPSFDAVACQFAIHYACESEETFQTFVDNIKTHCKRVFFGTCMDGAMVYAQLMGAEKTRIFRAKGQVFGQFTKEYEDGDGWTEEFGKSILVKLESFEAPQKEYLVPFIKVNDMMEAAGFELQDADTFFGNYYQPTRHSFDEEQKDFSFLHRTFAFVRKASPEEEEEPEVKEGADIETFDEEEGEGKKKGKEESAEEGEEEEGKKEEAPTVTTTGKKVIMKVKRAKTLKPTLSEEEVPVLFFMGNTSLEANNYLSNFYEPNNKLSIDGKEFSSVEHYFQWRKAKEFGTQEIQDRLLASKSQKEIKRLGGPTMKAQYPTFEEAKWDEMKKKVMATAMRAKFNANPDLKEKLLATGDRPLGEANPYDKFWGIGKKLSTQKTSNPASWPTDGNWTGRLLADLRSEFKAEAADSL